MLPNLPAPSLVIEDPAPAPVAAAERIASIDVLRGVALLGILMVNIWSFALPLIIFSNPSLAGGYTGANYAAWWVSHFFFEEKMMSIFSMLFGAGLVVMTERTDARGLSLTGVYYRRILWLLAFGLLHAYGLWEGDILFSYAICGLVLFPLRRLAPALLTAIGLIVFSTAIGVTVATGLVLRWAGAGAGGEPAPTQSTDMAELQRAIREFSDDLEPSPDPAEIAKEIKLTSENGYWPLFRERAGTSLWLQTGGFVAWAGPRAGGLMLLGMALMKLGVFTAARSLRFYLGMAIFGFTFGFPLVGYGMYDMRAHDYDSLHDLIIGGQYNYIGSLFVALGYVGMVMTVCRLGWLRWLTYRLAAVGRMALTNYFSQTLICTTLFYGYGYGLFGQLDRIHLVGVVVAVWLFQLIVSPIWLRFFRFGPAEWLWRSLTYWRLQPFLGNDGG
jgi:uncharacterized protein